MGVMLRRLEESDEGRFRLAVVALALLLRLACLALWQRGNFNEVFGYDLYVTQAQSWLGWIPPTQDVTHPPVYAAWIAGLFLLLRQPAFLAVQLGNVLLSTATCLLVGAWAERAVSKGIGRLSALWCAADPLLVFFSVQLQSESFFLFLQMLFFLWLWRVGNPPATVPGILGVGALGGVVTLTRTVFALYPPFLVGALLWARSWRGRSWLWTLLFVGWALPISFWAVRNQAKYHEFIPLTTNGGWTLWEGFSLDREEVRRRPYDMLTEVQELGIDPVKSPKAGSDHFSAKWKRFVRENPGAALKIVLGKAFLYWRPWPYDPHSLVLRSAAGVYFTVLFALALFGAWRLRAGVRELAPVFALFLYLSLLHSVFFTSLRYRVPLEPFLCVLAAAGLRGWLARREASGVRP